MRTAIVATSSARLQVEKRSGDAQKRFAANMKSEIPGQLGDGAAIYLGEVIGTDVNGSLACIPLDWIVWMFG